VINGRQSRATINLAIPMLSYLENHGEADKDEKGEKIWGRFS
jgi:hypothetical protein